MLLEVWNATTIQNQWCTGQPVALQLTPCSNISAKIELPKIYEMRDVFFDFLPIKFICTLKRTFIFQGWFFLVKLVLHVPTYFSLMFLIHVFSWASFCCSSAGSSLSLYVTQGIEQLLSTVLAICYITITWNKRYFSCDSFML